MANAITLITKYLPVLDAKYQWEAKSSILDAPEDMIRETEQAKTILFPKMTLQGLGDYSRNTGFVQGDATLVWQSHTFTQDRGRSFTIDRMDDVETAFIAFGRLAGEFIRLHVAPELDAYRFSKYASVAGTTVAANLTKTTVLAAIDTADEVQNDAEVPEEGKFLFISNGVNSLLKDADGIQRRIDVSDAPSGVINRKVRMLDEMQLIKVPKTRFQTLFDFYDGTTGGQEAGGFVPNVAAKEINFMMLHPTAVLQIVKTAKPRYFDPDTNQTSDGHKFDYRIYHDAFVPDNKTDGIYVHTKA